MQDYKKFAKCVDKGHVWDFAKCMECQQCGAHSDLVQRYLNQRSDQITAEHDRILAELNRMIQAIELAEAR